MDRIHALSAEREELLREVERERAEKSTAQTALSEVHDKTHETLRSLGAAEQHKITLEGRVSELGSQLEVLRSKHHKLLAVSEEREALQEKVVRQEEELRRLRVDADACWDLKTQLRDATTQLRSCQETLERDKQKFAREAALSEERVAQLEADLSACNARLQDKADQNGKLSAANAGHIHRIEELTSQKNAAETRGEELQRRLMEVEFSLTSQIRHLSDSNRKMEDEGRRLEEQNRLAGFQFQKLGEESSRLLSACEVERDLRSKLEAALHIKERQVSLLLEMN